LEEVKRAYKNYTDIIHTLAPQNHVASCMDIHLEELLRGCLASCVAGNLVVQQHFYNCNNQENDSNTRKLLSRDDGKQTRNH
jgi:hypothetical protein